MYSRYLGKLSKRNVHDLEDATGQDTMRSGKGYRTLREILAPLDRDSE